MRISDWSSDVCSSDLLTVSDAARRCATAKLAAKLHNFPDIQQGNLACQTKIKLQSVGRIRHAGHLAVGQGANRHFLAVCVGGCHLNGVSAISDRKSVV